MPIPVKSEWKKLIQRYLPQSRFAGPVSIGAVEAAEDELGSWFPPGLRALLLETDGVGDGHGANLVWPLARIEGDNLHFRHSAEFKERYKPLEHLLFFGEAANGDCFAFAIGINGHLAEKEIFRWCRDDDSRSVYAHSLRSFFENWAREVNRDEQAEEAEE
jgi:cell wall assembly regulator SMI1